MKFTVDFKMRCIGKHDDITAVSWIIKLFEKEAILRDTRLFFISFQAELLSLKSASTCLERNTSFLMFTS